VVVAGDGLGVPRPVGDLEDRAQSFDAVSSGPNKRKVSGLRTITSRKNVPSTRVRLGAGPPRRRHLDRVLAEIGSSSCFSSRPPLAWGLSLIRRRPSGRWTQAARQAARPGRRGPRAGSCASSSRAGRGARDFVADGVERHLMRPEVPSIWIPSTIFGPVQPWGVRRMSIGQAGRLRSPPRAFARIASISSMMRSMVAAIAGARPWAPPRRRPPSTT